MPPRDMLGGAGGSPHIDIDDIRSVGLGEAAPPPIQEARQPASCTIWGRMPSPSERMRASSAPRTKASDATISETTMAAPKRAAMRRA